MHPQQYGQDPQEGYDYRNVSNQHGILRSSSTMSVNVPYADYEHRRQMEIHQQQQQQQQWGPQRGSAFQKYQTRSRRGESPAPSNKSNKSRSKSLPGKNFGRRTTTSESEEDGGEEDEEENCEEFFSSSHAHDESEEEENIPEVAPYKWECEHCTYVNDEGTRVCAICCKTPTGTFNPAPNENQSSRRSTTKPSNRRGSAKQQIAARRRQEQELRANEEARERRRLRSIPNENNESDAIEDDYAVVKRGTSRTSSRKSSRATEQPYKSIKVKSETKSKSKESQVKEIIKPEPVKVVPPPQPTVDKKGKNKENKISLQPALSNKDKKASSTDEDSVKPIKKKKRISFWFGTHFNAFKKN